MTLTTNPYANRLLRWLPQADIDLLHGLLEPVQLEKSYQLAHADWPVEHVYFLESGVGSIVAKSPEGHEAEAGLFGRDGFGPAPPALGLDRSPFDIYMQVPGAGYRLPLAHFHQQMAASPTFARLVQSFAYVLQVQTIFTGLSNAIHMVDERLARWILMCHDRIDGDEIALTHEFLSLMLAVRRPSVTTALHNLEGNRFIYANRGHVTVRDRARLEEFAKDSYGKPEAEYTRLFGTMC